MSLNQYITVCEEGAVTLSQLNEREWAVRAAAKTNSGSGQHVLATTRLYVKNVGGGMYYVLTDTGMRIGEPHRSAQIALMWLREQHRA